MSELPDALDNNMQKRTHDEHVRTMEQPAFRTSTVLPSSPIERGSLDGDDYDDRVKRTQTPKRWNFSQPDVNGTETAQRCASDARTSCNESIGHERWL